MNEALKNLFSTSNVKEFAKRFKAIQEETATPLDFVAQTSEYLPIRLYERYYDEVPHSFFGLSSAVTCQTLFPEQRRWWPVVQHSWHAARERKRSPWSLEIGSQWHGSRERSWEAFLSAYQRGEFDDAFKVALAFLERPSERDFFRSETLSVALLDATGQGLKFLYLFQTWELAQQLDWKNLVQILFPALHYLVIGPRRTGVLEQFGAQDSASRLLGNNGRLTDTLYERVSGQLRGEQPEDMGRALNRLAKAGVGREGTLEALILGAAEAIVNAKPARWVQPVRALLFTFFAHRFADGESRRRQSQALRMSAALVQEAAAHSHEPGQDRNLREVSESVSPLKPLATLRTVVSQSDPYASASAVYAVLGMGEDKRKELFQNLATLAAKNDGHQGTGYDLLLVKAVADCYQRFNTSYKDQLPAACGFLLARLHKSYQLFGAYGV